MKIQDYQKRPAYGTYAFCVKTYNVNIPEWVREMHDEESIQGASELLIEDLFHALRIQLKEKFLWIEEVSGQGRSGGWVVVDAIDDVLDEDGTKKRLEDLTEVAQLIEGQRAYWQKQVQTGELWQQVDDVADEAPDVQGLLRDVVDSYDDTGCDDCGVISADVYEAARKAIYPGN